MPPISGRRGIDPFSATSISENIKLLHDDSPAFWLLKEVLRRPCVLSQVESTDGADGDHGDHGEHGEERENDSTQSRVNFSSAAHTPSKSDHGQKRQRHEKGNSENSEDERGVPRSKRPKVSQPKGVERPKLLACPFWKLDPIKHRECFSNKTPKISYVKQHLERRHTPDFYCQRCYIIFSDAEAIDNHVLEASCTRGPSAILEGVSQSQKKQLPCRSKGSVEDQWYTMWDILFPGCRRPSSIYVDSGQSEDFCRIKEFSQREGVTILHEELRTSGLLSRLGTSDEQVQETIQRAMHSMFECFHLGRIFTATRSSGPSDQETPVGSGESSKVVLQPLHSSNECPPAVLTPPLMFGGEEVILQQSTSDDRQLMVLASDRPLPTAGRFQQTETLTRSIITPQITVDPAVTGHIVPASLPLDRSARKDTTSPLHGSIHEGIPPQRVTEDQEQVDINTAVEPSAIGSLDGGADDPLAIPHDFDLGTWHW